MFAPLQASDGSKKAQRVADEYKPQKHDGEDLASQENDSVLLPHERVGGDFSWLQGRSQEDLTVQRAKELDDEESFLYGSEETGGKQDNKSPANLFAAFSQIGKTLHRQEADVLAPHSQSHHHQTKSTLTRSGDKLDWNQVQPPQATASTLSSPNLDSSECEKIKRILKSLGTADISDIVAKVQGQRAEKQQSPVLPSPEPTAASLALSAVNNPKVRHALESLQSLIKGEDPSPTPLLLTINNTT